jgi:predicted enzyme related to lactoylglutathione lyase
MTTTPGLIVNLDVDDLDKAIAFYTSTFGLTVGRQLGGAGVEILGTTAPLYFLVNSAGTPASPTTTQVRTYERHWTPVHLDFVVEELEPIVEKAVLHGAVVEVPIATHKWGRMAVLADPFGHGFCIIQFLGRGYDEVAT